MDFAKIKHLNLKTFIVLAVLLLLAYATSFSGDWALDDDQNILTNQALHIEDLSFSSLKGTLFASPYGAEGMYRPLSCLTLGINWYFGQNNPLGYHIVNFIIHLLSAFFLFTAVKLLWQTPRLKTINLTTNQIYLLAFFAALLWALHPIHVQAVTYIVQRMASLMAMFYILGIVCFLYARNNVKTKKLLGYLGCALSFVCAMLAKENAPTFILALLVIHWVFYMQGSFSNVKKRTWALMAVIAVVIVIGVAGFVFWAANYSTYNYGQHFSNHYFNSWERLLTQSRVIFMYLYQIFWPVPSQFQIEYYVPISRSLFNPPSTILAGIAVIALIVFAFIKTRKWPLVSFAILFFFAAHAAESTIWILEMAFEYRNYIPSMFISLPIVYGFMRLYQYCAAKDSEIKKALPVVAVLVLFLLGFSTFLRNMVWQNEPDLYLAAINHNPNVTRSYVNYGHFLIMQGQPQEAIPFFQKAIATGNYNRYDEEADAHFNLANAYLGAGDYPKAIEKTLENIKNYPENALFYREYLAKVYELSGNTDAAVETYTALLGENPQNLKINYNLGGLLFSAGKQAEALPYLLKAYDIMTANGLKDTQGYTMLSQSIGICHIILSNYAGAHPYLLAALNGREYADAVYVMLWIIGADRMEAQESDPQLTEFLHSQSAQPYINTAFEAIAGTPNILLEFTDKLSSYIKETF